MGWDDVQDEIERLERTTALQVMHVISDPPEDCRGESGLVDKALLARHLPAQPNTFEYFIFAPEPLEESLRQLGVDCRRIYSERIQIV